MIEEKADPESLNGGNTGFRNGGTYIYVKTFQVPAEWAKEKTEIFFEAIMVSQVLSIICYVILFFTGKKNFIFLCVMTFISVCFSAMQNGLVNVLVNDTIDFIMLKEGVSGNGIISSLKGFAQKCGNMVVTSGILVALGASGYVAGAIGHQNAATMFTLNFLKFGAPCVTGIVLILCVAFNLYQKYYGQIEEMKREMDVPAGEEKEEV